MDKMRFNGDWIPMVEEWAADNAPMIERYEALQTWRKMQTLAEELTKAELHQFYTVEGMELREGSFEDEIFWEE